MNGRWHGGPPARAALPVAGAPGKTGDKRTRYARYGHLCGHKAPGRPGARTPTGGDDAQVRTGAGGSGAPDDGRDPSGEDAGRPCRRRPYREHTATLHAPRRHRPTDRPVRPPPPGPRAAAMHRSGHLVQGLTGRVPGRVRPVTRGARPPCPAGHRPGPAGPWIRPGRRARPTPAPEPRRTAPAARRDTCPSHRTGLTSSRSGCPRPPKSCVTAGIRRGVRQPPGPPAGAGTRPPRTPEGAPPRRVPARRRTRPTAGPRGRAAARGGPLRPLPEARRRPGRPRTAERPAGFRGGPSDRSGPARSGTGSPGRLVGAGPAG